MKDVCTSCGWQREIVETRQEGKRTVTLCERCAKLGTAAKVSLENILDKFASGEPLEAPSQDRLLKVMFRTGFVLGLLLGTGIAFAVLHFIVAWF